MIAANLKKLIENSELKPSQISRKTGIPTSRISEIVTGKTKNPGVDTLFRIVDALGGNLNFVVSGKGEMFLAGLERGPKGEKTSAPDSALLQTVIEAVEEILEEKKLILKANKKAQLIVTLYEMFSEEGKTVDKPTVLRLIKLAA